MSRRITRNVTRPAPVRIYVNDEAVDAYPDESIVTALLAAGRLAMSLDDNGRPRAPYCNMGVCFECLVSVDRDGAAAPERVRACLTPVREGLRIRVPGCFS